MWAEHSIFRKYLILLSFIPLILSIGIIPAIPFSEAAETLRGINLSERDFSCRAGQTMVFHYTRNNYICTATETANRWVELGMAEIVTVSEDEPEQKLRAPLQPPSPFMSTMEDTSSQQIDFEAEKSLVAYADGGKDPLTVTPVLGTLTKQYEPYPKTPGKEPLAENEMRVTICGSGMPYPTYSQAAGCVLVELGNGDMFLFDIGSNSISRINGLGIPLINLTKVFVGHLHADHVGDLGILLAQGFMTRAVPIELYGPSGPDHSMGTAYFAEKIEEAYKWDIESRRGAAPTSGMTINVHEFDFSKTQVVYEENGVQITSFPAIHTVDGSVSYRLDWNDLTFVFSSDTHPNEFFIENAQNADFLIHESFATAEILQTKLGFSEKNAKMISEEIHTPPSGTGVVFSLTNPRLAGMYHQLIDDEVVDSGFADLRKAYDGPAVFLQDLTLVNITPDYILVRQAVPNLNPFPEQDPAISEAPLDEKQYGISEWLEDRTIDWKGILENKTKNN